MRDQLDDLRKQIDLIDESIIHLLAKRLAVVKEVGVYKKHKKLLPLDRARWRSVLTSKIEKGKVLGMSSQLIRKIYEAIHQEALKIEREIKI